MNELLRYFNGNETAASIWKDKYCVKDKNDVEQEATPDDMHRRMAKEFGRMEYQNFMKDSCAIPKQTNALSDYGRQRWRRRMEYQVTEQNLIDDAYQLMKDFGIIVPQGSVMAGLGNPYVIGSLSNCFVIGQPYDSYGGIFQKDEQMAQLMKRRGGVGIDISTLRPESVAVSNTAGNSTGAVSFMHRYSNTTREVAQEGRRGALMITIDCHHPDLEQFIDVKMDKTKVTGANISVQFHNDFYEAVEKDYDYLLKWPVNKIVDITNGDFEKAEYNVLYEAKNNDGSASYWKKVQPKKIFEKFTQNNWESAEPGTINVDRHWAYSPDGVYPQYKGIVTNPCGEIFMGAYDACRLIAINLLSIVENPYTDTSSINTIKLYKYAYEQQIMGDNVVDLELEHITEILLKIDKDEEPDEVKRVEKELWEKVYDVASGGRRTGCGITALGDMLAAMGLAYESDEAINLVEEVMSIKMGAELDATIDLAILRGPFKGWNKDKEFCYSGNDEVYLYQGGNDFFQMIMENFPEQANKMFQYGRRNVSWSTSAPTGSLSEMTQTTGGMEPLFSLKPFIRRRKINPSDKDVRVDFVDDNGDSWQDYPCIHGQVIEWYRTYLNGDDSINGGLIFNSLDIRQMLELMPIERLDSILEQSPWHGSCAEELDWKKRVEMQAVVQKYTTHSISSTVNLPKDVPVETVREIYMEGWRQGLKGITIYRDTCRDGVLIKKEDTKTKKGKRPKSIDANLHIATSKGKSYAIIVGVVDSNPYELFAFEYTSSNKDIRGKVVRVKKGSYSFVPDDGEEIANIQQLAGPTDERILTRWASLALRQGASPEVVIEQVDRSEVQITSFARVISRVLKTYIKDDTASTSVCGNCGAEALVYQEGCLTCKACGVSKC